MTIGLKLQQIQTMQVWILSPNMVSSTLRKFPIKNTNDFLKCEFFAKSDMISKTTFSTRADHNSQLRQSSVWMRIEMSKKKEIVLSSGK